LSKKNLGKQTRGAGKAPSSSPMDLGLLEQLVKLMAANDLNTVEVRDGDKRVVLKRGPAGQPTLMTAPTIVQAPAPAASSAPAAAADDTAGLTPIKSPMVGTFYSSPSPDAKAFVVVGSTIDEETDVCIIEAMKVFNNIKAECRGTIAKILVTNGQTVEFGQVLFLVKPA
jgi:acetyl-CoA carboxylase biotin carboxyl carrier protein